MIFIPFWYFFKASLYENASLDVYAWSYYSQNLIQFIWVELAKRAIFCGFYYLILICIFYAMRKFDKTWSLINRIIVAEIAILVLFLIPVGGWGLLTWIFLIAYLIEGLFFAYFDNWLSKRLSITV